MADLLTIAMLKERFPDGGPSERLLRETFQKSGKGIKVGRRYYVTEGDWLWLLSSANAENIGTLAARSQCAKRTVGSRGSAKRNQLERSVKLEQLGLLPTSRNTTTNKPTGQRPRLVHPSQTRP